MRLLRVTFLILIAILILAGNSIEEAKGITLLSLTKIYDTGNHCAFTTLEKFGDTILIAFREAPVHNPTSKKEYGQLTLLKLLNGSIIDTLSIKNDTMDLRDPFLFKNEDMVRLYCFYTQRKPLDEGENFCGTLYSDYTNGVWSPLKSINVNAEQRYVLWKVRKVGQKYLSIGYNMKSGPVLFCSLDGINWEIEKRLSNNGNFTEGDLVANGDDVLMILRNEDYIGAPSVVFHRNSDSIRYLNRSIAAPELLRISPTKILCAGREYDFIKEKTRPDSIDVTLLRLTNDLHVADRVILPTGRLGDKGYTGMYYDQDTLYLSYYTGTREKTGVYLAKFLTGINK